MNHVRPPPACISSLAATFRFPNIILEMLPERESTPKPAEEVLSPVDFSLARPPTQLTEWRSRGEEDHHNNGDGAEENLERLQLKKALTALLHGIDSMTFTREEMLRLMKVQYVRAL